MPEKQVNTDPSLRKTPDYLVSPRHYGDAASGALLVLFFATSILSVIISTLVR